MAFTGGQGGNFQYRIGTEIRGRDGCCNALGVACASESRRGSGSSRSDVAGQTSRRRHHYPPVEALTGWANCRRYAQVPQGRLSFTSVQISFLRQCGSTHPSATAPHGSATLHFVIPRSRLAGASWERNDPAGVGTNRRVPQVSLLRPGSMQPVPACRGPIPNGNPPSPLSLGAKPTCPGVPWRDLLCAYTPEQRPYK